MLMPMMQIRQMRMSMLGWLMLMNMSMASVCPNTLMRMVVMNIIMTVAVSMFELIVKMGMPVFIQKNQSQRAEKRPCRNHLDRRNGFSKENQRKNYPEKRTAGKNHLRPRGP